MLQVLTERDQSSVMQQRHSRNFSRADSGLEDRALIYTICCRDILGGHIAGMELVLQVE